MFRKKSPQPKPKAPTEIELEILQRLKYLELENLKTEVPKGYRIGTECDKYVIGRILPKDQQKKKLCYNIEGVACDNIFYLNTFGEAQKYIRTLKNILENTK